MNQPGSVDLTWLSVANWLVETPSSTFLIDGYVTRFPSTVFADPSSSRSTGPVAHDRDGVRSFHRWLGTPRVDALLASHSHFDHTWDTADWASVTGARVIGSRTTILQCAAQDVPATSMTEVRGGDVVDLGADTTCHVAAGNHAGDPSHLAAGRVPRTLTVAPDGGAEQRPGVLEDYPNGGGSFTFLLVVDVGRDRPLTIAHTSSVSAHDFDDELVVDGVSRGTTRGNLETLLERADVDRVDVWLAPRLVSAHECAGAVLAPRRVVLQHWDSIAAAPGTSVLDPGDVQHAAAAYPSDVVVEAPRYGVPITV